MINEVTVVAVLFSSVVAASGDESSNTNAPLVIIEIAGGFGHLTSLELKADGTFKWHGWEPGRRVVSIREGKLDAEELQAIVRLANRVSERISGHEFAGGENSYSLVLRASNGRKHEIKIRHAKDDQRPAELKRLLDSLWATRVRQERRSEPTRPPEPAAGPVANGQSSPPAR
jgi:hypothetical protein